jgi:oligopeptide transport system ATP-binding protein
MIAIAISCAPDLLIADEPTTALDVTIQAQIIDLLLELKSSGCAIILVTHNLGLVANFADRIQVMYAGQIMERGQSRDIFYNPRHPYTWALMESIPKPGAVKEELYYLRGTPPDLILPLECCPFAARCEYCMPICKEVMPPEVALDKDGVALWPKITLDEDGKPTWDKVEVDVLGTHSVACWLTHPDAPEVSSPVKPLRKQDSL